MADGWLLMKRMVALSVRYQQKVQTSRNHSLVSSNLSYFGVFLIFRASRTLAIDEKDSINCQIPAEGRDITAAFEFNSNVQGTHTNVC